MWFKLSLLVSYSILAFGQSIIQSSHTSTASIPSAASSPYPLIIWHGLGDKYDNDGIQTTAKLAEEVHPGTFTYIIRLSNDSSSDQRATFFGNVTTQLDRVCEEIASHPVLSLAPAVNALGFSQGGQFLRGYVERCNSPPVHNLVTFGSQHNGISEFQECGPTDWLCKAANGLLSSSKWSDFVQGNLVPAQYFRDPEDLEPYLESSNFLADINNERELKNKAYKKNIELLHRFVMFLFEDDDVVVPKETSWFAEFNQTSEELTPLQDRKLYKEDWLGLKKLDEKGGLVFKTTPGGHMKLSDSVLRDTFKQYFGPAKEQRGEEQEAVIGDGARFDDL